MSDLRELYQDVLLDHYKHPRNHRALQDGQQAEGFNPLCGDKITVYVKVAEGRIADLGFQGSGCAISQASASLMTETLKGKTPDEAAALFQRFHALVTGQPAPPAGAADLGKLVAFSGVSEFPVRVKCASLAWHTLRAALKGSADRITTE